MPRRKGELDREATILLDSAYQRLEASRRAVEQGRRELGQVMRSVGLSASARHLAKSREWARQLATLSEGDAATEDGGSAALDSIPRLGVLEPIVVEMTDADTLHVVDGHRRLAAAREAGLMSIPMVALLSPRAADQAGAGPWSWAAAAASPGPGERRGSIVEGAEGTSADPLRVRTEALRRAVADHSNVRFEYLRSDGVRSNRSVHAWGMVERAGRTYLIGFDDDRDSVRTFRVDRIEGRPEIGPSTKPPPKDFRPGEQAWGPIDPDMFEQMEGLLSAVLNEHGRRLAGAEDGLRARRATPDAVGG